MGNIYGYSYENKEYKNKKRIRKHRKLLKDLFYKIAKEVLGDNWHCVKFRLSYKKFYSENSSKCSYYLERITQKKYCVIKLDLESLKRRVYYGYNNGYYNCRVKRVNPHVVGNRKKARLFVIYHELSHAKQFFSGKSNRLSLFRKETEADIFALSKIGG